MFACKNNVVDSALDGVGMGLGYTLTATLMASIREILGSGTWLGFQIIPESVAKVSIMTQAPGAFFCFGLLMAGCVWLEGKLDARIERKSCCDLDNLTVSARSWAFPKSWIPLLVCPVLSSLSCSWQRPLPSPSRSSFWTRLV